MHRVILRAIIGVLIALVTASCTNQATQQPGGTGGGNITPVFAFTEALVGTNRIAIGLLRDGSPINDPQAQVHLRFFDLTGSDAATTDEKDATYYGQGLPAGIYVAYTNFAKPGTYGVEISVKTAGQTEASSARYQLDVKSESAAPQVGQPAISTKTLTVNDVPDVSHLSSGPSPDPALYQVSLDQALTSGKPIALLFATPNFCRTATCGPSVQVLSQLQKKYGDRMVFIHTEVYKYPFGDSFKQQTEALAAAETAGRAPTADELHAGMSDAMVAWGLPSEPWLFLIDGKGVIAARYEGGITSEEIGPAIDALLAGKPIGS
ncbi:MAG TPA: thioredoxin family protein [Roseiflexaceae bacterium]|nr:thioredoxin family protein [Roseiflexaceae bacterium]